MRALRILIVDNDGEFLDVVAHWLSRHGFMTMATADASEAISAAQRVQIDAAIVDIGCNDSNRYRLLRRLRDLEPGLGIVVLRQWWEEGAGALNGGPVAIEDLVKPFTLGQLEASVRRVLGLQAAAIAASAMDFPNEVFPPTG